MSDDINAYPAISIYTLPVLSDLFAMYDFFIPRYITNIWDLANKPLQAGQVDKNTVKTGKTENTVKSEKKKTVI